MNCEIRDVIEKDEQYARGWVRLHDSLEEITECAHMGQYAVRLMRLKWEHIKECEKCAVQR